MFSLLLAWVNFSNSNRVAVVEKHHHVLFRIYFIILQSSPSNSKISKRNWPRLHPDKLLATTVRFIIKIAGKIFQGVIISVFSINACTQICYNGWGGENSLVLISPPHKPYDLFWLWPGALAIFYHGFWLAGWGSIYCRQSIPTACQYRRSSWVKNDLSLK